MRPAFVVLALVLAGHARAGECDSPAYSVAAARNAASVTAWRGPVFSRSETTGWETYLPQIQTLVGTTCDAASTGFAASIAAFQSASGLTSDGVIGPKTLAAFVRRWQAARALYVRAATRPCPFTGRDDLVRIAAEDDLGANDPRLDPAAYAAWRRMRTAAVRDGVMAADSGLLKFVAAYRSPERARQLAAANPDTAAQGSCSVHISGFAADLNVGHAPGYDAISSANDNRLWQSRQPVYRWMVKNAGRFGFVNYVFEPWHWEYTGPDEN